MHNTHSQGNVYINTDLTIPFSGSDDVGIGPLECHMPWVAPQNPYYSFGKSCNHWNYGRHRLCLLFCLFVLLCPSHTTPKIAMRLISAAGNSGMCKM